MGTSMGARMIGGTPTYEPMDPANVQELIRFMDQYIDGMTAG